MARNLIQVLNQILSHVPSEEETFKEEIEHQINSASYAPPEVMHAHWDCSQNVITTKFKMYKKITDIPEWGQKVIKIWTNKPN